MARTDREESRRLVLQVERDLVARTHLGRLLAAAQATVAGHRKELRAVTTRMRRGRPSTVPLVG